MDNKQLMHHILVVDDDKDIASLFQAYLEANGFRVTVAYGGATALQTAQDKDIDAIVTDLSMPDIDGLELVKSLRTFKGNLPAIIVSGYPNDFTADLKTVVLNKPVSLTLLSRRLRDLLIDADTARNLGGSS